ncbi:hypothetical protein ABBQ32_009646 [Trebouxia sp. C0010 RCD-2024]
MNVTQEASHVLEQLVGEFKRKFADSQHQQGVLDSFKAFTAAVDWKELRHKARARARNEQQPEAKKTS